MSLMDKLNAAAEKAGAPKRHNDSSNVLLKKLDGYLEERNDTEKFVQKTGFAPSDTINCSRRSVYLLRGVEVDNTKSPRVHRILDNGHAVHERLVGYAKEAGILVSEEEEGWWEDPPYHFYIDMIVNLDGEILPVEIKSIGQTGYDNRLSYDKPKVDHRMQLMLYLYFKGYTKGIVLYECKNDQEFAAFEVTLDVAEVEKMLTKKRKAYADYQAGILPKRPAKSPSSSTCTYCELKDICWKGWPDNLAP